MHNFKKACALLLAVALLVAVPVTTVSAESETIIVHPEILNSITLEEATGNGLAFLVTMNIKGAAINAYNEFINDNATAVLDGVEYSVVSMGVVTTNQAAYIDDIDNLTREDKNAERTILDVPARYLCAEPEADSCSFAVRIINLPDANKGWAIACRPYIVLKDADDNEITHYGDSDIATYNEVYYTNNEEETPVLNADLPDLGDKITITAASAEYAAYAPVTYREAFKIALTLENVSPNAKTSAGDSVTCVFKDADGNELGTEKIVVDVLTPGDTKDVEFYAPIGTAAIETADINLNYVPDIILPAIGSDIDVTKKKNRIRVSASSTSFNEDGTIHVSLTFRNYTSNWITEETDYIKYAIYAGETKKATKTLYIGVIDTKKNPVKTFEFDVPADTTKLQITSSKIVYWTEWA